MEKKMKCPRCGAGVEMLCSNCWRCKNCVLDCPDHMKRTINGTIGGSKVTKR